SKHAVEGVADSDPWGAGASSTHSQKHAQLVAHKDGRQQSAPPSLRDFSHREAAQLAQLATVYPNKGLLPSPPLSSLVLPSQALTLCTKASVPGNDSSPFQSSPLDSATSPRLF